MTTMTVMSDDEFNIEIDDAYKNKQIWTFADAVHDRTGLMDTDDNDDIDG
jgi:hypothetical protein